MIYNKTNFVDTSQVLNDYIICQENADSPLVFKPKFARAKLEKRETLKTEPIYIQNNSNWRDSLGLFVEKIKDLFSGFLIEWEESLSQLKDFIENETNPVLEKPSSHSIFTAFFYLFAVYKLQPDSQPELAMSGDGGIYLEWNLDGKFVSIQVDREKNGNDRIYIEQAESYGSTKLTEETLKEIFSK